MKIHIIKESDGNGIVAVFATGDHSINIKKEVKKALNKAIDNSPMTYIDHAAKLLEKKNILLMEDFSVSEF